MQNLSLKKAIARFLMLCIILQSLSLLFAGCSAKEKKGKSITLMFWGDVYNRAFAQKLVDRYNSKNPPLKVKLLAVEQEYESKVLTMSAGGIPPDIILVSPGKHIEYSSRGIFLALDRYAADPEFENLKKDMWQNVWDGCEYDGKLYVVPIWTSTIGIFYNKGLFDKAGVSYPSHDWDFDEFLDKAKRLTVDFDNNGRIDQFGFGDFPLDIGGWDLYMLIEAFGGHLYSNDGKECLINTPEAVNAIQWAVDLSVKHHVCPTIKEVRSGGKIMSASGEDYFRSGRVSMVLWGRWYLDALKQSKDLQWGVAPFPRGKRKAMFQYSVYLAISSKTEEPDECWKFLKFIMGKEGQEMLTQDRSDIPVLKSMAYSNEFLNYAGRPDANEVFLNMFEYATTPKSPIGVSEWYRSAYEKMELVTLGRLSVKKACDEIAEEYRNLVKTR